MDYRLTEDKPFTQDTQSTLLATGAAPASHEVTISGIYTIAPLLSASQVLLVRVGDTQVLAETIVPLSVTPQDDVCAHTLYHSRTIYAKAGQFIGFLEQGATVGISVIISLLHRFEAQALSE